MILPRVHDAQSFIDFVVAYFSLKAREARGDDINGIWREFRGCHRYINNVLFHPEKLDDRNEWASAEFISLLKAATELEGK